MHNQPPWLVEAHSPHNKHQEPLYIAISYIIANRIIRIIFKSVLNSLLEKYSIITVSTLMLPPQLQLL